MSPLSRICIKNNSIHNRTWEEFTSSSRFYKKLNLQLLPHHIIIIQSEKVTAPNSYLFIIVLSYIRYLRLKKERSKISINEHLRQCFRQSNKITCTQINKAMTPRCMKRTCGKSSKLECNWGLEAMLLHDDVSAVQHIQWQSLQHQ